MSEVAEENIVEFDVAKPEEPWRQIICEHSKSGRRYWRQVTEGVYCCDCVEDLRRWLKSKGLLASLSKDDIRQGETISEVDQSILDIQKTNLVHYAGPFAGWHAGVHAISGRQVLVTEALPLVDPKKPKKDAPELPEGEEVFFADKCHGWPNIGKILNSRLYGDDPKSRPQVQTCLSVIQRAYMALRKGQPRRCQAMVFAGETSAGKSLFIDAILRPIMGGRAAYPLQFMLGTTDFNAELHEAALWKVDDEATKTKIHERKHLAAKLKQAVAVKGARLHDKGSKAVEIETQNLLVFATNLEEQNLLVLPPLDNDVEGKIHLFKYHQAEWPCWPLDPAAEEEDNAAILRKELPHFLYWLTREYETPDEIWEGRFGVQSFYHEEILEKLDFLSHEVKFYNLLERTILKGDKRRELTAGEIYDEIKDDPNVSNFDKDSLPDPNPTIGKYLSKLKTRPSYKGCISGPHREGGSGKRQWTLMSRETVEMRGGSEQVVADEEGGLL